jgi:hypothetical protein
MGLGSCTALGRIFCTLLVCAAYLVGTSIHNLSFSSNQGSDAKSIITIVATPSTQKQITTTAATTTPTSSPYHDKVEGTSINLSLLKSTQSEEGAQPAPPKQQKQQPEYLPLQPKQRPFDVKWVHDEDWFQNELNKGCCPFTSDLYNSRYAHMGNRCCLDRIKTTTTTTNTIPKTTTATTTTTTRHGKGYRLKKDDDDDDWIRPLRPIVVRGSESKDPETFDSTSVLWTFEHLLRVIQSTSSSTSQQRQRQQRRDDDYVLSILIQGDSIAEQHFLSLLCLAWSTGDMDVDLKLDHQNPGGPHLTGTLWSATLTVGASNATTTTPTTTTTDTHPKSDQDHHHQQQQQNDYDTIPQPKPKILIRHLRWDLPKIDPLEDPGVVYSDFDYIFLGGWHHGGTSNVAAVANFLTHVHDKQKHQQQPPQETTTPPLQYGEVSDVANDHETDTTTLTLASMDSSSSSVLLPVLVVVEALPDHFPGGSGFRPNRQYPLARVVETKNETSFIDGDYRNSTTAYCDTTNYRTSPLIDYDGIFHHLTKNIPINSENKTPTTVQTTSTNATIQFMDVAHLYYHRGDANIGLIPANTKIGILGRDCLHYCVSPGVLDGFAMKTLGHIITNLERGGETSDTREEE